MLYDTPTRYAFGGHHAALSRPRQGLYANHTEGTWTSRAQKPSRTPPYCTPDLQRAEGPRRVTQTESRRAIRTLRLFRALRRALQPTGAGNSSRIRIQGAPRTACQPFETLHAQHTEGTQARRAQKPSRTAHDCTSNLQRAQGARRVTHTGSARAGRARRPFRALRSALRHAQARNNYTLPIQRAPLKARRPLKPTTRTPRVAHRGHTDLNDPEAFRGTTLLHTEPPEGRRGHDESPIQRVHKPGGPGSLSGHHRTARRTSRRRMGHGESPIQGTRKADGP